MALHSLLFLTSIAYFFELSFAREYLVSQEFTSTSFSTATGWSTPSKISYCYVTDYIDWSGSRNFVGILTNGDTMAKTFSSLPPHWSLSLRLDLLLYASIDPTDNAQVYIGGVVQDQYTKADSNDGLFMCYGGSTYGDELILYSKNITHTTSSVEIKIKGNTDQSSSDEGINFKNFYLYVDTCDYTCASCNGPSSTQCTACPANSTQTGSSCICNSGYIQHQYTCVTSCPAGYKKDANSNNCINDYCLNCQTCNTAAQSCTTCSSGYYLYKGYCLTSCPNTSTLSSSTCVDFDSGLTNPQYLINGLTSQTFGESEIKGMGLTTTNFKGLKANMGVSGAMTTNCGTTHVMGGFFLAGTGASIQRSWTGLAPHWSLKVGFTFWKMDSWDNEYGYFKVDGVQKDSYLFQYNSGSSNLCGMTYYDTFIQKSYNFTHASSSLSIQFTTNLDEIASNEGFAIRDLYVLVDYCPSNCATCDASGCLTCNSSYLLYYSRCIASCPSNAYLSSATTCSDCNANCKTCISTATNCTTCNSSNYLTPTNTCAATCPTSYYPRSSDLTCQSCDSTCYNCVSPGTSTNCTSCNGSRYLSSNQCITTCPNGTYPNTACNTNCTTCNGGNSTNCLSCTLPKYYQATTTTCVVSCNSNQYADNTLVQCFNCHSTCTTCSGPNNNNCLSCSGALYFDSVAKTCVSTCPNGTYANTSNNTCTNCNSTCTTCTGGLSTNCLTCTLPRYFQSSSNSCVLSCNSNQYTNNTSPPSCQNCNSTCTTCSGTASNNCLTCSGIYYLNSSSSTCVTTCPTSQWQRTTDNTCQPCDSTCYNCVSPGTSNNCTNCSGSLYLYNSQCITTCPSGTYSNTVTNNNQCLSCNSNCKTCSGGTSTNCLSCNLPMYYQSASTTCVASCNSNQYGDNTLVQCVSCHSSCATCSGPNNNNCLSCSGSLYFDSVNKICVATCPNGTYANTSNNTCTSCNSTCTTCNGPNATDCLSCTLPRYYQSSSKTCVTSCNSNQYSNSTSPPTCQNCYSACATCSGTASNNCLTCSGVYYFNSSTQSCETACPIGQWQRTSDNTCQPCDSTCYSCLSPGTSNSCQSCSGSLYLYNNQCLNTCTDGTYSSPSTNNNKCLACNSSCKTCDGPNSTNCLSCTLPKLWQASSNTCVASCNSNQYADTTLVQCLSCDSSCTTCFGPNNNNCLSCSGTTYFNSVTKTCVSTCPIGTYSNTSTNVCSNCDTTCTSCDEASSSNCLSCTYPSRYYQTITKQCVTSCNSDQYGNSTSPPTCQNCHSTCSTCSGTALNNCLSCSGSLYLSTSGNTCQSNCLTSEFKNISNNQCVSCHSSCYTCSGSLSTNCLSCQLPLYYQASQNTCISTCDSNQYSLDSPTPTCNNCNISCNTCSGPNDNDCLSCSGSTYLNTTTKTCVSTCPDGTYKNTTNHECSPCHSDCTTCNGPNNTQCLSCTLPLYLQQSSGECVLNCNSNQYKDNSTVSCKNCDSTCLTCSGAANNNCLSCSGSLFLDKNAKSCISTCPPAYYKNSINNECSECDSTCETCDGGTSNNCLTCVLPNYFQSFNQSCNNTCDLNQFKRPTPTPTCQPCDSSCATCSGPSTNECLSCSSPNYLQDPTQSSSSCLSLCPDGTYQNTSNQQCSKCDSTCKTCSNSANNNCISCTLPRYFQPSINECVLSCQSNQYTDDSTVTCRDCHSTCTTCSESGADTKCLSCSGSLFLNTSTRQCQSSCPDTFYKNTSNNICTQCNTTCYLCDEGTANDCLSCQLPLYYQQSSKSCVSTCNSNQYKDSSLIQCMPCDSSCSSCFGKEVNNCLSCSGSTYLNTVTKTCESICPDGTYPNTSTNVCSPCDSTCKTCNSYEDTSCLSCSNPRLLQQPSHQCVTSCNSNQYQDNSIPQCMQCDTTCTECNGPASNQCTKCSALLFLNPLTNECVSACPIGYYKNIANNECSQCDSTCHTCDGPNSSDCLDCSLPRYYQFSLKTCVLVCNSNQFKNNTVAECQLCHNECATCSGPLNNECTSCDGIRYLNTAISQCVTSCPDGQFNNSSNNICTACDNTCKTCNEGSSNNCMSCSIPRYYQLSTFSCDLNCQSDQYKDNLSVSCKSCENSCTTCSGPNNNQCLSCSGSLFLDPTTNMCISTCPDSYYANIADNTCQKCDSTCKTCNNKFNTNCLTCNLPLYYHSSTSSCVSTCDSSQYKDNTQVKCINCHASCSTCSGSSSSECLSCPTPTFLNHSTNTCISSCPSGYFDNITNNECTQCDTTCLTCSGASNTSCLTCSLPLYLQQSTNSCDSACQSNQYADNTDATCKQCHSTCTTCSGPSNTQCLSCSGSKYLYNNECIDTCPNGKYPEISDNTCKICNSSCDTCNGPAANNCLTCSTTFLYQNQCLSACPNKYYKNTANQECSTCNIMCGNCTDSSATSCLSCPTGYLLQETYCVANCSTNYYKESTGPTCKICDSSCKTCTNSTLSDCSSCNNSTYLLNGQCITTCPGGYYADNSDNTCKQCDSTCKTCNGGLASQCTQCDATRFLYINTCMTQCPDGFFNNVTNQICTNCDSKCQTCNGGTDTQCLSCSGSLFLYQNQCIPTCQNGFYKELANNKCEQCNSACDTCSSFTDTSCLTCKAGTYLQLNSCVSQCSKGTFGQNIINSCEKCDVTCDTCTGPSISECQSCVGTKFLYKNQCNDVCPDGFYNNLSNNMCSQCNSQCDKCSGGSNTQCTSCLAPLILYNNECTSTCPSGLFKNLTTNSCNPCSLKCKNCSGPSDKECLSCQPGKLLQETQCLKQCSDDYFENKSNNQCSKCHLSCKTCSGPNPNQCETCPDILIKFDNKCLSECPTSTYQKESSKECSKCDDSCASECTGPSKQDCLTIKPQNQLIVIIFSFKTVIWILSVFIGIIRDKKGKDNSKLRVLPSTLTKPDQDEAESINKKRSRTSSPDVINSPIKAKKLSQIMPWVSSIQDNGSPQVEGSPQFDGSPQIDASPHQPINSSFFPQTQIVLGDQQQVTFHNENDEDSSPKQSPRRKQRRKDFIMRSQGSRRVISGLQQNPSSNNIGNSQLNTVRGSSSQVFDKLYSANQPSTVVSSLAASSIFNIDMKQEGKTIVKPEKQNYKPNEKLKHSILGNEWLSFFTFYDSSVSRVCRTTLIYLKYQMFFFICQQFSLSPMYYVTICLVSGLFMKLVLGNLLSFVVNNSRHGNGLSMMIFLGVIGTDLGLWFIPKILSINYNQDYHWSILYLITFSIDLIVVQQILGLIQYLSTIKFLNLNKPNKNIHNFFKNNYLVNRLKQ